MRNVVLFVIVAVSSPMVETKVVGLEALAAIDVVGEIVEDVNVEHIYVDALNKMAMEIRLADLVLIEPV